MTYNIRVPLTTNTATKREMRKSTDEGIGDDKTTRRTKSEKRELKARVRRNLAHVISIIPPSILNIIFPPNLVIKTLS